MVLLGELSQGEQLLGVPHLTTILSREVVYRPTSVYNLENVEVFDEHGYQGGTLALLVHNGHLPGRIAELAESNMPNSGKTVSGHFPGYIDKAKARGPVSSTWATRGTRVQMQTVELRTATLKCILAGDRTRTE